MKTEKLPVKIGIGTLDKELTREQAIRYANKNIPSDLKRAGFKATVSKTDQELHGGVWYRINYMKTY